MEKQKYHNNLLVRKMGLFWILTFVIFTGLRTQTTLSGKVNNITVPNSATSLYIDIKGGDGGDGIVNRGFGTDTKCHAYGGAGAVTKAVFPIGNGANEIPPGSTIRFIRGEKGGSENFTNIAGAGDAAGAGAGGSAVLYRQPGATGADDWKILAVAGGGGGAYAGMFAYSCTDKDHGKGGTATTAGGDGKIQSSNEKKEGGKDGGAGASMATSSELTSSIGFNTSGGGAGAFASATDPYGTDSDGANKGYPSGGSGGHCPGCESGGFGFGGGGFSFYGPGGGGGYSGGGAGSIAEAGGGGSYLDQTYTLGAITAGKTGGGTKTDGYIKYRFNPGESLTEPISLKTIQFALYPEKCLDDADGSTANGANIQIFDCNGYPRQQWIYNHEDQSLRLGKASSKCINLNGGNTSNGNNIELKDCNGSWAQKWYYNAVHRTLHVGNNTDKCMDVDRGNYNIRIYDCRYDYARQKWIISGVTATSSSDEAIRFVPMQAQNLAVHSHTYTEVGSNIQLWTLDNINDAMIWYFDGLQLKMKTHPGLCIDLKSNNVSNGNNIQLWTCKDTDAQKWIYDGLTKTIRSANRPDKCMEVADGNYEKRGNIQIWDCNGTQRQKFLIYTPTCAVDTTPPEAKCQDVQLASLEIPTAEEVNNGSTDNCSIGSFSLDKVSGNTWKLTVTDESGNSSSCTATVSYSN